jgi:hypothetical protein
MSRVYSVRVQVCPLVLLDSTSTHAAFTPHVLLRFRRSCPFEQFLLLSGRDDVMMVVLFVVSLLSHNEMNI